MPQFKVQAPDGKVITVEGPEGATQEQAIAFAQAQYKPQERSAIGDFFTSMPRGMLTGLSSAASTLGQAEAAQMGMEGVPGTEEGVGLLEKNVTGDLPKPQGLAGRVGASIGESVANPASWVGPGGPLLKTAGAVASGVGSELAGEAAHDVAPSLELPARMIGGGVGGRSAGAAQAAKRGQRGAAALKTGDELHDSSQAAYKVIEQAPLNITPPGLLNLHNTIEKELKSASYHPITAKDTYALLNELLGSKLNSPAKLSDIIDIHEMLGHVSPQINAKDAAAAQVARGAIRDWLDQNVPQANAPLRQALGDWSSHKKIEEVQKGLTAGEHRAQVSGVNSNTQNTIRQEIRKILDSDKRLRGFRPEEREQMEKIVAGTMTQNLLRRVSKSAPDHLTLLTSILNAPVAIGAKLGAMGAQKIGDILTRRQVEKLMSMIQERAPSNEAQATANRAGRLNAARNTDAATVRGAAVPAVNYLANPGQQGLE